MPNNEDFTIAPDSESTTTAERMATVEDFRESIGVAIRESLSEGLEKPPIQDELRVLETPDDGYYYAIELLTHWANPFGGLHLERVQHNRAYDHRSGREYNRFKKEGGIPPQIPDNVYVLTMSAMDLLGVQKDPMGLLERFCIENGVGDLDNLKAMAVDYEDSGWASIRLGPGMHLTFPVQRERIYDREAQRATYELTSSLAFATVVVEMDRVVAGPTEDNPFPKLEPFARKVVREQAHTAFEKAHNQNNN